MLAESYGNFRKVYLAVGYTDLRKGILGLSLLVGTKFQMNPYEKDVLFLFCGKRCDRIKGLVWEGTGYLLLYKRLEAGAFSWPRSTQEAAQLTEDQFRMLMIGLNPLNPKIREITPDRLC